MSHRQYPKPGGDARRSSRDADMAQPSDGHGHGPPMEVQRWLRAEVGPLTWGARLDAPFGQAWVQRCAAAGADAPTRWVLKCHRSAAGHRAERTALRQLAGHLGRSVPALVAASDAPRALLLRDQPGIPADQLTTSVDQAAVHAAAGRFLARLQAARLPTLDALSADAAIAQRRAGWLRHGRLPDRLNRLAERLIDPSCFVGARRVWAHRDYLPANWLWHGVRARRC